MRHLCNKAYTSVSQSVSKSRLYLKNLYRFVFCTQAEHNTVTKLKKTLFLCTFFWGGGGAFPSFWPLLKMADWIFLNFEYAQTWLSATYYLVQTECPHKVASLILNKYPFFTLFKLSRKTSESLAIYHKYNFGECRWGTTFWNEYFSSLSPY